MSDSEDTTDDHREQDQSEVEDHRDLTAIADRIERIERALGRPLPPAVRQLLTDPPADPPATFAEALQAAQARQPKPISVYEYAARQFDPTPGGDTSGEE